MRLHTVLQIAKTSLRESLRSPEALFWTYGFPLLMALGLGLAFQKGEPAPLCIAVVESDLEPRLSQRLQGTPRLEVRVVSQPEATRMMLRGSVDLVLTGSVQSPRIEIDAMRPGSELARLHVEKALAGPPAVPPPSVEDVQVPGSRYVDWLIPGLIGLNLLGSGMWGIGYALVHMRVKYLLRRLIVSPMGRAEFLLGFLASRLLLGLPESLVITGFGILLFGMPMVGSWLLVLVTAFSGAVAFGGLGLLIASRVKTLEGIGGMMNLVILPMWLCGGSFFSNERFPQWTQPFVQALPLSQLNEALRTVILYGGGWSEVAWRLAALWGLGLLCFLLALRRFRWT